MLKVRKDLKQEKSASALCDLLSGTSPEMERGKMFESEVQTRAAICGAGFLLGLIFLFAHLPLVLARVVDPALAAKLVAVLAGT